jgi:hypothetical protein
MQKANFISLVLRFTLAVGACSGTAQAYYGCAYDGNCHYYPFQGGADKGVTSDYACGSSKYTCAYDGHCHLYSPCGADRGIANGEYACGDNKARPAFDGKCHLYGPCGADLGVTADYACNQ